MIKKSYKSILLMAFIAVFVAQCTHDDELVPIDSNQQVNIQRGTDLVNSIADSWTFDKAHSNVRWETAYQGSAALLTGRFNQFDVQIQFDESNPDLISITASVVLSTVNTGEPGRDGGCLLNTFDVATSDVATFVSTSCEFDPFSSGYLVTGNLTFHGVTDEVTMKLDYAGTAFNESGNYDLAGFSGEFDFFATSIFGIESSSISDKVTVLINSQYRLAK